jgi:hypothetical protein
MQVTWLTAGRGWLDAPAAASLARVDAQIGHPLQVTESGRTRAQQQAHWDRYRAFLAGGPWAALAARPGTSPHEYGNAIDTNERLVVILHDHGWRRPIASEPWHFVYNYSLDNHRFRPAPASGTSTTSHDPEGDDMPDQDYFDGMFGRVYRPLEVPGAGYGYPEAILNDVRGYGNGLVARVDASNTGITQLREQQKLLLDAVGKLVPGQAADIQGFKAALEESDARVIEATEKAIEEANVTLASHMTASLAETFGLPAEAIKDAIDEALSRVYVNYRPTA